MTLVGKIFTVLILLMSVAFLMLSVTVFATHTNWRDVVMRPREGDKEPGLKVQIEELSATNKTLRQELERAGDRLAIEQAARRYALAALQTKLESAKTELQMRESQFAELQAAFEHTHRGLKLTVVEVDGQARSEAV